MVLPPGCGPVRAAAATAKAAGHALEHLLRASVVYPAQAALPGRADGMTIEVGSEDSALDALVVPHGNRCLVGSQWCSTVPLGCR